MSTEPTTRAQTQWCEASRVAARSPPIPQRRGSPMVAQRMTSGTNGHSTFAATPPVVPNPTRTSSTLGTAPLGTGPSVSSDEGATRPSRPPNTPGSQSRLAPTQVRQHRIPSNSGMSVPSASPDSSFRETEDCVQIENEFVKEHDKSDLIKGQEEMKLSIESIWKALESEQHERKTEVSQREKKLFEVQEVSQQLMEQVSQKEVALREVEAMVWKEKADHEETKREHNKMRRDLDTAKQELEQTDLNLERDAARARAIFEAMPEKLAKFALVKDQRIRELEQMVLDADRHVATKPNISAHQDEQHSIEIQELEIAEQREALSRLRDSLHQREEEMRTRFQQIQTEQQELTRKSSELERESGALRRSAEDHELDSNHVRLQLERERQQLDRDMDDFRRRKAESERELQRASEQLTSDRLASDRALDQRDSLQRTQTFEKESLKKKIDELKKDVFDLECQLRQERNASNLLPPGEHLRAVRAREREGESLCIQLSDFKCRSLGLEADLESLQRENEALRRHLTPAARSLVQQELASIAGQIQSEM